MFHIPRLALTATLLAFGLVASTSPSATALPDWRTSSSTHENPRAFQPKVVDVRYAEHRRYDRVVVDVTGRRPGYTIKYTKDLRFDGSGKKAKLPGKRKMQLILRPAVAHDDSGSSVYDGPRHRRLDYPTLRGIKFLGDFEGQVTFGFGLDRRAPYRIFTLTSPSRVVIDFKH